MKTIRLILLALPLLLLGSCHSSKKAVYTAGATPAGRVSRQVPPSLSNEYANALVKEAYGWLGTPYSYGGKTKKGTDCSGFTMQVFQNALGIKLPRSSRDQSSFCSNVKRDELIVGDLVFFNTRGDGRVSHVGIYVGDEKVIHASSHGVMVNDLNEKYYQRCFHHCGRVSEYAGLLAGDPVPVTVPETIPDNIPTTLVPEPVVNNPVVNTPVVTTTPVQPAGTETVPNPRHKTARHH